MELIWNRKDLERPPNATFNIERGKFDATVFFATLQKITRDLNSQELLHKEAAILSRLIYRMKGKFRNDKGLKSMCKVNRALLNYLNLPLEREIQNLESYVELETRYVKVPSKQMVEYVLVKIQGFAKLLSRVEDVSKYSAHFLRCRIAIGHAWAVALMAYSVISRIWLLSRYLVKNCCTWYNDLYQHLKFFKATRARWLPKDYELTDNLESWLALPWIKEPVPSVPTGSGLQNTMFRLITPRDFDSDEDIALDIHDYSTMTPDTNASPCANREIDSAIAKNTNLNIMLNDDKGEIIDRNTFNSYLNKTESNTVTDDKNSPLKPNSSALKTKDKKQEQIRNIVSKKKLPFESEEDTSVGLKREKITEKPKSIPKKERPRQLLSFEDVKKKSDLLTILNRDAYPGLDKLQWNMIRNRSNKLLDKFDKCPEKTKQTVLLKKIIKRMQGWVT